MKRYGHYPHETYSLVGKTITILLPVITRRESTISLRLCNGN